eukprot:TRINITY_DN340_c0_g1_i1.p1 TRINITY_DN340_c0_g1~~TRINITY_DN340_c0_g1_i1.p1  ORF type:complete len:140 (+),score=30.72 TRINITY_DN340_c0_g1_i1:12-431(+)
MKTLATVLVLFFVSISYQFRNSVGVELVNINDGVIKFDIFQTQYGYDDDNDLGIWGFKEGLKTQYGAEDDSDCIAVWGYDDDNDLGIWGFKEALKIQYGAEDDSDCIAVWGYDDDNDLGIWGFKEALKTQYDIQLSDIF